MATALSSRRLWLPVGALGMAAVLASALMLAQAHAPVRLVVEQPASVVQAPSQPLPNTGPGAPVASKSVPVKAAPGGVSAAPAPDRCSATLGVGRARVLPMCAPPIPQP